METAQIDLKSLGQVDIHPATEAPQFTIESLQYDTLSPITVPNFDSITGEDLRANPEKQQAAMERKALRQAEADMRSVLGYREGARFSHHSGQPLPEIVHDEKGNTTSKTPLDQLRGRIDIYRNDIVKLVTEAQARGVNIPKFDSVNGSPIPENSLRALLESGHRRKTEVRPLTEQEEDLEDIKFGLEALRLMKEAKKNQ